MGFFNMGNILKVVFVIIGTLIGAGFASGQEMYLFFFSYGVKGMIGIIISSIMIGFVIYKTLKVVQENNITTYKEFLNKLIKTKNEKISIENIINIFINIFILVTFFIMIAGFGAYFEQEIGTNNLIGSIILAILCFLILMKNVKGVVRANEILVPVLIASLVIIGVMSFKEINFPERQNYIIQTNQSSFILSAMLYSSYNTILLIPILLTLKKYLKNRKQILKISYISTIIIISLSVIIFLLLTKVDVDITALEMPAVYVVSNMFKILKYVYGFIILGSIFTTAISLGMSFLQNTAKDAKNYKRICLIICITSVMVSRFGFSNLVNSLYPIFGYLGLIQMLLVSFK